MLKMHTLLLVVLKMSNCNNFIQTLHTWFRKAAQSLKFLKEKWEVVSGDSHHRGLLDDTGKVSTFNISHGDMSSTGTSSQIFSGYNRNSPSVRRSVFGEALENISVFWPVFKNSLGVYRMSSSIVEWR